jgi:D-beta-D-heptose 7-phosphate kinase/D-beta-D-heptose 1-phosphate adenosyltransferase
MQNDSAKDPDNIILITGGFDPVHSGHLDYIEAAKKLGAESSWFGSMVIVGVNSDEWLVRKKGKPFMPLEERVRIMQSLKDVDQVIVFDDSDNTAIHAIKTVRKQYPNSHIIFANGGDRTLSNIPETAMSATDPNITFVFGVGGNKVNSSSWILGEWKAPKTERPWGYYRVLHENGIEVKVKELTVQPGKSLSMQRHSHRNEFWFVAEGVASVYSIAYPNEPRREQKGIFVGRYNKHQHTWVLANEWHQLVNEENEPLKVIEVQFGDNCTEDDIQRVSV